MKKIFIVILILFTLALASCGASNAAQSSDNGNGNFSNAPLPLAMQLVVGTFKLEGTSNAVTAEQAAKLIPLWQVYKDLSANSSAAPQEIQSLAEQIQSTMTPQQVQAITDLKLTRRDISQTMQDLGVATLRAPNASGTPRANGGGGFPGGGGGGGGFPGGGQGGGQNLSPQQIATFQALRAKNGGGSGRFNQIPPALFDALIKLLQSKK